MTESNVTSAADFGMEIVERQKRLPALCLEDARVQVEEAILYYDFDHGAVHRFKHIEKDVLKELAEEYRDAGWVVHTEKNGDHVIRLACKEHKKARRFVFWTSHLKTVLALAMYGTFFYRWVGNILPDQDGTERMMTPSPKEQIAARDREMDLLLLAEHTRTSLYTWTMPADFGLDHGIKQRGKFHRTYMSDGEILQGVLEWKPQPGFDNGEEFPEEIREYARQLWADLGEFIRTRCTFVTAQGGGPRCYDSL